MKINKIFLVLVFVLVNFCSTQNFFLKIKKNTALLLCQLNFSLQDGQLKRRPK